MIVPRNTLTIALGSGRQRVCMFCADTYLQSMGHAEAKLTAADTAWLPLDSTQLAAFVPAAEVWGPICTAKVCHGASVHARQCCCQDSCV